MNPAPLRKIAVNEWRETRGNLKMAVLPLSKLKSGKVSGVTVKNFFKRIKPLFKRSDN